MSKTKARSKRTLMHSFRRALVMADISMDDFARARGVSRSHLYRVVVGERQSEKLLSEVRALIAEQLPAEAA